MTASKGIPTAEEFERASQLMKERARGLDRVREGVRGHFRTRDCLHEFFILDQRDVDFRAYAFFRSNEDLEQALESGLCTEIVDYVYEALEREGRGRRGDIEVGFEFDSDEHVQAAFEGDYSLRLRG